ncbi:MAG: hypothetical protein AAGE88_23620 [Actinomycetota bacterium]
MTCVRAPGSSANLGPGFDVLGVAVSRHVWVSDDGVGTRCDDKDAVTDAFRRAGGEGSVWLDADLPAGRGLGFSAAMRSAAAVLARLQQGDDPATAREVAFRLVTQLEGHADNAAPAVFGGVQLVVDDDPISLGVGLPGRLLVWVPELITSTDGSRRALPPTVSRHDTVFNLSRVALLTMALLRDDSSLLRRATEDRLHQPQRLADCAPSRLAIEAALDNGAAAAWLSGSGPSVAVVLPREFGETATAGLVEALCSGPDLDGRVLAVDVDRLGAVVSPDDRPSMRVGANASGALLGY